MNAETCRDLQNERSGLVANNPLFLKKFSLELACKERMAKKAGGVGEIPIRQKK